MSRSQDLNDCMVKIMTWSVRFEDAETQDEAQQALRKIKRWSERLAYLQQTGYATDIQSEESTHEKHTRGHSPDS